jgi:hypothetical protein
VSERWIIIPNWRKFQHYQKRDGEEVKRPEWIKNYGRLLHDDAYLALSLERRGVLHGLWLEYAASGRQLIDSTCSLSRRLDGRVTRATLDALNHAGFIAYSSSPDLDGLYTNSRAEQIREEKSKALAKNSNGSVDLPQDQDEGEGESTYALVLLLAAVEGSDAVKAQLRSKVEQMELAPFALHSAREELLKAKLNGKKIRSEAAYVLAICERYAEPNLEDEPKAKA